MEPTDQNNNAVNDGQPAAGAEQDKNTANKPEMAKPDSAKPEMSKPLPAKPAAASAPPPAASKAKPAPARGGRGLSALALLVGLAALGLSGWQWYQGQAQVEQRATALDQQLEQISSSQRQSQQVAEQRLEGLPSASQWQQMERLIAELQRGQQAVSQRLEGLQGDAAADWKLAEAEHLLRLASLRLLAAQDVTSARELLEAVDEILKVQPDSGVFAVREQLAQYRGQLDSLPVLDRAGVFLRLSALREQVGRLVALPVPVFDPDEVSAEEEYEDRLARRTRGERMLMRLERYVRVDFQRGKVITPLLDEAEMQRVRRTLQLGMEQAQWAALRGEGEVYRTSLEQAEGILRQFFELDNPQVKAMQGQLANLAEQQVTLTAPDLSPLQQGLAAYIQSRRSLPDQANGETTDE